MSATDDLRSLLDERGVEWWEDAFASEHRTVFDGKNDVRYCVYQLGFELFISSILPVTPEQAIEATLGRGECELKRANWDDGTCTWGCICSACDAHLEHETGIGYSFCPHCGAKVVRA